MGTEVHTEGLQVAWTADVGARVRSKLCKGVEMHVSSWCTLQ